MKAEGHRKVAQWHLKQADMHEGVDGYACGCPLMNKAKESLPPSMPAPSKKKMKARLNKAFVLAPSEIV